MKTALLATTAALAAFMLATPVGVPQEAHAKIKVNAPKVKPRVRVRPRIRVNLNTKRLTRKTTTTPASRTPQVPEGKRPANRTTTISRSPNKTPSQRFSTIAPYGSIADAVREAMERFGAGDPGNFNVEDMIDLDRFSVGLGLGGDVLGNGEDNADDALAGLQPPAGGGGMFDPNDVLPGNDNRPDGGHLSVHNFSAADAREGTTSDKPDQYTGEIDKTYRNEQGQLVEYRRTQDDNGYTTERTTVWESNDPGNQQRSESVRIDDPQGVEQYNTFTFYNRDGTVAHRRACSGADCNERNFNQAGYPAPGGVNELRDPDAPGDAVIPVNCGSVACNEARKNKGLQLTGNPHNQVLTPGPADDTGGTVGNAPYTGKYWRDVATTNPGSEPQDHGDNGPLKTDNDQVLVIDDGTGPVPPTVPGG